MKLLNLSAQQLLKKLKNKQLTSVELCKAYINQKKKMSTKKCELGLL